MPVICMGLGTLSARKVLAVLGSGCLAGTGFLVMLRGGGGLACGSSSEDAGVSCSPPLASASFFFLFLIHRTTAHLFEIIFTLHCYLEEKASANETGELIWSARGSM